MIASQMEVVHALKARLESVQLFATDVDNCVILSERPAGLYGVIPAMSAFQREVCGLELAEGQLICWKTGERVDFEGFLRYQPGNSMIDMLQGVAKRVGVQVEPEKVRYYDVQESLYCCDAFDKEMEATPGALEMLSAARSSGRFKAVVAVSSSVLRRLECSLGTAGLLQYYDSVYSAQSPGWIRNGTPTTFEDWNPPAHYHSVAQWRGEPRPKPRGDVYEMACELQGVRPKFASTIEDSRSGVIAAREAGIGLIIGYTGAVPFEQREALDARLREAGAHIVIDDHSVIAEALMALQL